MYGVKDTDSDREASEDSARVEEEFAEATLHHLLKLLVAQISLAGDESGGAEIR